MSSPSLLVGDGRQMIGTIMKNTRAHKSVGHYFMMGPVAVESHVDELDEASELHRYSCGNRTIIRDCLRSIGLGKVTPRVRGLLRILGTRTLAEINTEQAAFRAVLGGNLRPWEIGKSPPCPVRNLS